MKKSIIYIVLAAVLSAGVIYSCKKSDNKPSTSQTKDDNEGEVEIENFAFSPATINVKTGATVKWTNKDSAPHTVTDKGGAFDSGSLAQGQTFKFTFSTPGTYTYHCLIHSMMADATVVVSN